MERYVTIRYTYSVHTGIPTGTLTTDDRSIYRTWERLSLPRYTHTHIYIHTSAHSCLSMRESLDHVCLG